MLVPNGVRHLEANEALEHLGAKVHRVPFGDIWMRDIGPDVRHAARTADAAAVSFAFNGWGGKYVLDGDDLVGSAASPSSLGVRAVRVRLRARGAAQIEADGEGTDDHHAELRCSTTTETPAPPKRPPSSDSASARRFDARKPCSGSTTACSTTTPTATSTRIARFVEPGRVVCMAPSGDDDPNREVLEHDREGALGADDGRHRA